jgi:hypothetical protein
MRRAVIAASVAAAFLWALALTASPQLHQLVHPDADRAEHSCAVTLMATGSYEHTADPPVVSQAQFTYDFYELAVLTSTWVQPLFLSAHIFANAPPGFA